MTQCQTPALASHTAGDEAADLFGLLCQRRGWTPEVLREIECSDHDTLKDSDTMVDALHELYLRGETITIVPDFDMDGIASGVLGYAALSELGFSVRLHLPDYRRGHDVGVADMAEIAKRWPETAAILTCDGGINAHAGLNDARARGWMTLVTDHHEELPPGCPADIAVNPCRMDETYRLRGICGAHVLYQVLMAYTQTHRPDKQWEISLLRLFAGLGTISDVMPVLYENRQLVRDSLAIASLLWVSGPPTGPYGEPDPVKADIDDSILLKLLSLDKHHPTFLGVFRGFAQMMRVFRLHGKLREPSSLDEGFYGFYLAPAMNAARRTGAPLSDCFAVFTADDDSEMLHAMDRVIRNNELRKQLIIEHTAKILEDDQPWAPHIYFSDAPVGMLGLLANALMNDTGAPVVVLKTPSDPHNSDAPASGSARAPDWFDFISTLSDHDGFHAIGHQQACGVRLDRLADVDALAELIRTETALALTTADAALQPAGDLKFGSTPDCDARLNDVTALSELVRRVDTLKPFGHGFPQPMFEVILNTSSCRIDRIGSESQHLRIVTASGFPCLWWNAAERHYETLIEQADDPAAELHFLVKLQMNTFMGEERVQAVVDQQLS